MNKHKSNKITENSNTVRHLIMGQITTTQNLVAIKEVRHAGQKQSTEIHVPMKSHKMSFIYSVCQSMNHFDILHKALQSSVMPYGNLQMDFSTGWIVIDKINCNLSLWEISGRLASCRRSQFSSTNGIPASGMSLNYCTCDDYTFHLKQCHKQQRLH